MNIRASNTILNHVNFQQIAPKVLPDQGGNPRMSSCLLTPMDLSEVNNEGHAS